MATLGECCPPQWALWPVAIVSQSSSMPPWSLSTLAFEIASLFYNKLFSTLYFVSCTNSLGAKGRQEPDPADTIKGWFVPGIPFFQVSLWLADRITMAMKIFPLYPVTEAY